MNKHLLYFYCICSFSFAQPILALPPAPQNQKKGEAKDDIAGFLQTFDQNFFKKEWISLPFSSFKFDPYPFAFISIGMVKEVDQEIFWEKGMVGEKYLNFLLAEESKQRSSLIAQAKQSDFSSSDVSYENNESINYPSLPNCDNPADEQRLSFKQREGNGIGYKSGYSSIDGFFSHAFSSFQPFLDVRGHHFDDGRWAANAGVGLRFLAESISTIFGFNTYYDYRQMRRSDFQQVGGGIEVLGRFWDLRINAYFPFGEKKHRLYQKFLGFKGHSAFFGRKYEVALKGADIELGRELFKGKYVDLHGLVGGYYFSGPFHKHATGGLARLSSRITSYLTVSVQASYDSLFKDIYQAEVALHVPFGFKKKRKTPSSSCHNQGRLGERLVEPVSRFEIIVSDQHRIKSLARNPTTDEPYFFVFVDNQRGSSDGSFENPFRSLQEAQTHSSPGDVIYVFPGDGTTNQMNQGILLQDDQIFFGSANSLPALTQFGLQQIPAQTINVPNISNPGGNVVTLANNNQVTGFNIADCFQGVVGVNTVNAIITQNTIMSETFAGIDVSLNDFSGALVFQGNTSKGRAGLSISSSNSYQAAIFNNFFTPPSGGVQGITLSSSGTAIPNCAIFSNVFLNNGFQSIQISAASTNFIATIQNNVMDCAFDNELANGIEMITSTASQVAILNNTITNTTAEAFLTTTSAGATTHLDIEGNNGTNLNRNNVNNTNSGCFFTNSSTGTSVVRLLNNSSFTSPDFLSQGFVFQNQAAGGTFYLASPNGQLSGIASVNQGTSIGPDTPTKVGSVAVTGTGTVIFTPE